MALLCGEAGADTVRDLLERAERGAIGLWLSSVSLTEIVATIARTHGEAAARDDLRLLLEMPLEVESPTPQQCIEAGWFRAHYRLSTADAIIAAQAIATGAELVHKDPEFDSLSALKHRRLPYKPK